MALTRTSYVSDLLTALGRVAHTASLPLGEHQWSQRTMMHQKRVGAMHMTSVRLYPDAPPLRLPMNMSNIFASETGRFTPERARDIATPILFYGQNSGGHFADRTKLLHDRSSFPPIRDDTHVESYDCFGAVSLKGTMQTNVPRPFCSSGKSTHLNMPGGQWARDSKYIAEDMQKSHYRNSIKPRKLPAGPKNSSIASNPILTNKLLQSMYRSGYVMRVEYSTKATDMPENSKIVDEKLKDSTLSKREKFQIIVKHYGKTIIVFHIAISLLSLAGFYTAVVSGLDLTNCVKFAVGNESKILQSVMHNSSNFLIAYTVHKVFAPLRISITLITAPPLVKYLRKVGILKYPKLKPT